MAEALKNHYNHQFIEYLASGMKESYSKFDRDSFSKSIFDADWKDKELKERMRHISECIHSHLTPDYEKNLSIVLNTVSKFIDSNYMKDSFEMMFFPDYVELYGINFFDLSISALEKITQYTSCEFAIRPFIIKYPAKTYAILENWSQHKNHDVRRLSSEGCRPRLPWAVALPALKKDPSPILPILENLKKDPSEYVRRSVANNLNDISKDHPDLLVKIAKEWKGDNDKTNALIKHACRGLLKAANPEVLELFGFGSAKDLEVANFAIKTPKVKIGDHLEFEFDLINKYKTDTLIRLEYGLYYLKANGKLSKKVFKISEKNYAGLSKTKIQRRQSFKLISTRKFHLGEHEVSIIVNGREFPRFEFELIE